MEYSGGATTATYADCTCGWKGQRHGTVHAGSVLSAWELARGERNIHRLEHQDKETA